MILSLFSVFISNHLNSEYFYFVCYGLILTFGIIHGANDILILLKGKKQTNKLVLKSTLKYLFIVLLISILFFLFSDISLLFFVLFSAYHFGEQQWTIFGRNESKSITWTLYNAQAAPLLSGHRKTEAGLFLLCYHQLPNRTS